MWKYMKYSLKGQKTSLICPLGKGFKVFIYKIWLRIPVTFQLETKTRLKTFWIVLKVEVSFLGSLWNLINEVVCNTIELLNINVPSLRRIQLGWMWLCPPLHGVGGTVSWFVGGLSLPKTRQMYRFTSVKESFHLNCTFSGTTSAVWLNHFKNKPQPWIQYQNMQVWFSVLLLWRTFPTFLETAILHQRGL